MGEAEDWYCKSLAIKEELGDRSDIGFTYHQLAIIAQDRGRPDEADDWYRKSLAVSEELDDRPGMARTYAQLGLLAEYRGQPQPALEWNIRCVTSFSPSSSPLTGTGPAALARLTRQLGMPALEQSLAAGHGQARPAGGPPLHHPPPPPTRRGIMTDPAADAARAAAAILAPDLGPTLPTEVEAALADRQHPGRYIDPVSLASLIVAIATLAWTIYSDQRDHTPDPPPADIARQVRITLREQDTLLPTGTERITEIVATEIIRHASPQA